MQIIHKDFSLINLIAYIYYFGKKILLCIFKSSRAWDDIVFMQNLLTRKVKKPF